MVNNMSTQTTSARPLVTDLSSEKSTNWIKLKWKILLAHKKQLILAGTGIVVLGFGAFYFWGKQSSAPQYMTAKVERGNLRNTVTATGTLQAVTTIQVGSQASGTISALYADFNSVVKKGQIIAQLDPAVSKAQVDQARANLQQTQASLQQARAAVSNSRAGVSDAQARALAAKSTVQNNQAGVSGAQANLAVLKAQQDDALSFLKQQESLVKDGVIAQREYDVALTAYKTAEAKYNQAAAQLSQAQLSEQSSSGAGIAQSQAQVQQSQAQVLQSQAQVQQAQAQVQQAEAALRLAEVNLTHTTITSPIAGVVVSRDVNVGQTVAASLSAPTLFTIANDLTQMQVIANIDQADIGMVEQAKSAKFTVDAFPTKEYEGTIQEMRLNPQDVQNVVTYNVVINVGNPDLKLKPGMTANLTITIDQRNNVLKVPNAALRFRPQDATGQQGNNAGGTGTSNGQGRRQQREGNTAGNGDSSSRQGNDAGGKSAPGTAPLQAAQPRTVWVLGADGSPQARRITVGLTDGVASEVVDGNLKEGELVITGQTVTGTSKAQGSPSPAPGFGAAPRTGVPRGGGGGRGN